MKVREKKEALVNFEIELAIQVMFPSPGNQSQQIKRARAFVESEINDIDRQLSSSDSTSFSFGMNLGQNLSPDEREALEEKKRRWSKGEEIFKLVN